MTKKEYLNGVPFKMPNSEIILKREYQQLTEEYFIVRVDEQERYGGYITESHIVRDGVHLMLYSSGMVFSKFLIFNRLSRV
jgi:hypothetical protein